MNRGFSFVIIGVIVTALLIVGAGGYVLTRQTSGPDRVSPSSQPPASPGTKENTPAREPAPSKQQLSNSQKNLEIQYAALEAELREAEKSTGYLTDEEYARVKNKITALEQQGYYETSLLHVLADNLNDAYFPEQEQAEIKATEKAGEPTTTQSPQGPVLNSWVLPFEIAAAYNNSTKSLGDVSFAGSWVMIPFGEDLGGYGNPDIWFELVPGTILKASYSGRVSVQKNPPSVDPEGNETPSNDLEVFIHFDDGSWIEYDHVIEPMVSDGQFVKLGQPLGKAAPAWMRHGDPVESKKPVDEIEWGLRRSGRQSVSVCPLQYLQEKEREKLTSLFEVMRQQGFAAPESICLTEKVF